jgi:hypothetical protein
MVVTKRDMVVTKKVMVLVDLVLGLHHGKASKGLK